MGLIEFNLKVFCKALSILVTMTLFEYFAKWVTQRIAMLPMYVNYEVRFSNVISCMVYYALWLYTPICNFIILSCSYRLSNDLCYHCSLHLSKRSEQVWYFLFGNLSKSRSWRSNNINRSNTINRNMCFSSEQGRPLVAITYCYRVWSNMTLHRATWFCPEYPRGKTVVWRMLSL